MKAFAKINLALVVGPIRPDGLHEVATVLQRIDLHDVVAVEEADALAVEGYPADTLVADALSGLAQAAGVAPTWRATVEKRIPVAAGLGGGSSDAATALLLANAMLDAPLSPPALHVVAAGLGADVPFFLVQGTQLATGAGMDLTPIDIPLDYHVVVVLPEGAAKSSTRDVYAQFDHRHGAEGFTPRLGRLHDALAGIAEARDLAALPPNDLSSSPVADDLRELGAFRADVSGAGPAVYGLFVELEAARRAAETLSEHGAVFVSRPI